MSNLIHFTEDNILRVNQSQEITHKHGGNYSCSDYGDTVNWGSCVEGLVADDSGLGVSWPVWYGCREETSYEFYCSYYLI